MSPSQTLFYHFYAGLDMKRLEKIDFGISLGERLDEVRLLVEIFGIIRELVMTEVVVGGVGTINLYS
jgi:hypothetical protein